MIIPGSSMNQAWADTIWRIIHYGADVAPRGRPTREIAQHTIFVDMAYPVLTLGVRKLSYRAMAAEAYWILSGSNRLDGITPWIPRMAEFSDDGATLAGAYGPMIASQYKHVVRKLVDDIDTRQATITLWKPSPASSRDIPCTVAMDFKIRKSRLNMHVFMRSSDVWLGLPYDVFSFTCVAAMILGYYREALPSGDPRREIELGDLYLTAASSHLYDADYAKLNEDEMMPSLIAPPRREMPPEFYDNPVDLIKGLAELRDSGKGHPLRWWEDTP